MKLHRLVSLGLCVVCMFPMSACTRAPRSELPACVALVLEEEPEVVLALRMPPPTPVPLTPSPTPEPTPVPTMEPTPVPEPEPTLKRTNRPKATLPPVTKPSTPELITPEPFEPEPERREEPAEEAAHTGAYSREELELAAKVAYLEAKGKGETAYRAVLSVIYNRCKSSRFGRGETSISTEVYRKSQFSVIGHSKFETMTPPEEIVSYAEDVFCGGNTNVPEGVLFFRADRLGHSWGSKTYYKTIGGNAFYYGS